MSGRRQGERGEPIAQGGQRYLVRLSAEHRAQRASAVLLALLLLAGWATAARADAFQAKVIGVADGDTITVLRERWPETIRLNGIDAPEKGQAFGERAKQFTAQLAFDQVVLVSGRAKGPASCPARFATRILPPMRSLGPTLGGDGSEGAPGGRDLGLEGPCRRGVR